MEFSNGHGLLVGVGSYLYMPERNIPISVEDARAVQHALQDRSTCGYPQDQVTLLHDRTATRLEILAALESLAGRVLREDTVFLFYCGHGEFGADGRYVLTTYDTRLSQANFRQVEPGSGISEDDLLVKLRAIKANRLLLVVNACYAGELQPSLGTDEDEAAWGRSLPDQAAAVLLSSGEGRIIITASRPEQKSYIGTGGLSLFTQALVDGLNGSPGVNSQQGYIGAYNLYEFIHARVKAEAEQIRRRQEPMLTVLRGVGPFPVALYKGSAAPGAFDFQQAPPNLPAVRTLAPDLTETLRKAEAALHAFHEALIEGDSLSMQRSLEEVLVLQGYLKAEDVAAASYLSALAAGDLSQQLSDFDPSELEKPTPILNQFFDICNYWPNESCAALMAAVLKDATDSDPLRWFLMYFPRNRLSPSMLGELQRTMRRVGVDAIYQAREWPVLPGRPRKNSLPVLPGKPSLRNPFSSEKAEDEFDWLFSKTGLFWMRHPLFAELREVGRYSGRMQIVFGESGTGKTAMALALGRYRHTADSMACYTFGQPTARSIRTEFGKTLLNFIITHPTYLGNLGDEQSLMLASYLQAYLPRGFPQSELDRHASPRSWGWLNSASYKAQRDLWEQSTFHQYQAFQERFNQRLHPLKTADWASAQATCAKSLGFEHVHLVIDVSERAKQDWFENQILDHEQTWSQAGLCTTLFITPHVKEELGLGEGNLPDTCAGLKELSWGYPGARLEDMIEYRWERVNGRNRITENLPSDEFAKLLENRPHNPRRFFRLWNAYYSRKP